MGEYIVNRTDVVSNGYLRVPDSTLNESTSLVFPGRNQSGYATYIAENFLHMLENFAASSSPPRPIEGQLWYNTATDDLNVYDGTSWKSAGSVRKQSTEPSGVLGELWVNTSTQQLYLYNGSAWILVGPNFTSVNGLKAGLIPEIIVDSNDLEKVILSNYINGERITIYSTIEFVPKTSITGFSTIKPGVNISNASSENKFWGTAEKADALLIGGTTVAAANFLRKDVANVTNGSLTVRTDLGITTGAEGQLLLGVDFTGQAGKIYHSVAGSDFDIRVQIDGAETTLIRASSNGNVGIGVNNTAPSETLDVSGTSKFSDIVKITSSEDTSNDNTGALRVTGGAIIKKNLTVKGITKTGITNSSKLTVGDSSNLSETVVFSPALDNTFDIGFDNVTEKSRFRNIYAATFHGSFRGNVTGNVIGSASSLLNTTTFKITGDVSSSEVDFNGTGGGTKLFNTLIDPNFIDSKQEFTDVIGSDLLLVYRRNVGLGKIFRSNFLSKLPTVPIGAIFPFAGIEVPEGYLLCDGSEKRRAQYSLLFSVIGYTYGIPEELDGIATFRLPDLRGRFPLGRNTMDNADSIPTSTGNIDSNTNPSTGAPEATAGILGNSNGSASKTLAVENIPNHNHMLSGDNGTQFYATNNLTSIPTDTGSILGLGPDAVNAGQYVDRTGNMIGATKNSNNVYENTSLNIMNPYLTINYIIYTGTLG